MSPDVRIVSSEPRYLESFHSTLDSVARERRYLAILEAAPLDALQQFVARTLQCGGVQFFALDPSDHVVGWCDISRSEREGYRHRGSLGMRVLPEYRGRGIGTRLAMTAIRAARHNGIERIELQVYASNTNAIALYERLGFVREGVKRRA